MDNDTMVAIIKKTGSTEKEAVNHINNGALIYALEEKGAFIKNAVGCMNTEEEALAMWDGLQAVKYNDIVYKIDFVL